VLSKALVRHAHGRPAASVARELIEEGLARKAKAARLQKLAHDYAAGREDALELLADFEPLAEEVLGDEHA
jgi:hypothetical protein